MVFRSNPVDKRGPAVVHWRVLPQEEARMRDKGRQVKQKMRGLHRPERAAQDVRFWSFTAISPASYLGRI